MKKLSDFQAANVPRASISEGISIDGDENSLSEHSNSQNSLDDESFDDSTGLSNDRTNQITVKVRDKTNFSILKFLFIHLVCYQRSSRITSV
jgi:hypothetical protein